MYACMHACYMKIPWCLSKNCPHCLCLQGNFGHHLGRSKNCQPTWGEMIPKPKVVTPHHPIVEQKIRQIQQDTKIIKNIRKTQQVETFPPAVLILVSLLQHHLISKLPCRNLSGLSYLPNHFPAHELWIPTFNLCFHIWSALQNRINHLEITGIPPESWQVMAHPIETYSSPMGIAIKPPSWWCSF